MKSKSEHPYCLPNTGAILSFVARSFSVPTKGARGYSYKDFQRLETEELSRKERNGKPSKLEIVSRRVIDEIVSTFAPERLGPSVTDAVLVEKEKQPLKYLQWVQNSDGELVDLRDHLVRDLIEFIHRHEFLIARFGTGKPETAVMFRWLGMFALPFLVMNLVEYQRNGGDIERGMPRGRFWYLPEPTVRGKGKREITIKWPVNGVLEWWEDLLGTPLESLAHELCLQGVSRGDHRIEQAKRQVRSWMKENRPPKLATVERWCNQHWKYEGAFPDDVALPLKERWKCCRDFLERKGFSKPRENWLDSTPPTLREKLAKQYRGEPLEFEILPFKNFTFASFFTEPDPIAAKYPVEDLISRVAERYAAPTNAQLRARLLMAAGFQRAFTEAVRSLGPENTGMLLTWFRNLHFHFMDLTNQAERETQGKILPLLRAQHSWGDDFRDYTEWLFDPASWERFTAELAARFLEDRLRAQSSSKPR